MKIIYKHSNEKKPALFIDRDGVINFDKRGKYITSLNDVKIYKTAITGLKKVTGYHLIIITNQSAINRGFLSFQKARKINDFIVSKLKENNIIINGLYFCPHIPEENCNCRKPKTGLIKEANKDFKIDMSKSFIIGDKISDIKVGKKLGIKTILVLTGQGKFEYKKNKNLADFVLPNLKSIKNIVLILFCLILSNILKSEEIKNPLDEIFFKKSTDSVVERFEYDIYWGFINVGWAYIEYGNIYENNQGIKVYRIESRAYSNQFIDKFFKVRDLNLGYLDINLNRSYGYFKDIREGKYQFKEYTVVDYNLKKFYGINIKRNKLSEHSGIIENNVFDVLSSLFVVINSTDIATKIKTIEIITKNYKKINIINHGIFKVETIFGQIDSYKLEPTIGDDGIFVSKKGKSMYIYITKDKKIPVILEAEVFIGSVKAVLKKYIVEKSTK